MFDYIPDGTDSVIFEREPLVNLVKDGKMHAYKHRGFWKPMDMLRDNQEMEKMWENNRAPWKIWK